MNAEDPEGPHAGKKVKSTNVGSGDRSDNKPVGTGEPPEIENPSAATEAAASTGRPQSSQQARSELKGVDPKKLQDAIENLVSRIAEARSRGAGAVPAGALYRQLHTGFGAQAALDEDPAATHMSEQDWDDSGSEQPSPPNPQRHMAALELRMRQIADLAGAPLSEEIGADIAAIRGKMDRLSRAGGALSNRMETIQRQLSHLRESVDSSSAPVVERLAEMETRLDEIGEALSNRHLSVEARTAVELSCSHILGAIARIEGLARKAVAPEGVWDQIAGVRAKIDRLPTIDKIAGLERRLFEVSELLGNVAERSGRSEDLVNLEKRLSEIGAATQAVVTEMRERPAYDPTDVRTLLERIESWRSEKPSSDLPEVGAKLDAIARQVDQLSSSEQTSALSKIQEGLSALTGAVSAQATGISGLDLAGLHHRISRLCDELEARRSAPAVETTPIPEAHSPRPGYRPVQEDDEDHELAKRLATRFAPKGAPTHGADRDAPAEAEPDTGEDGAFEAVQAALEALVGQIPFLERTWETARPTPAPDKDRPAPNREAPRLDRPAASAPAASSLRPTQTASALAAAAEGATPVERAAPVSDAGAKRAPSAENPTAARGGAAYADAAHRIGRYSTWRKAKVAVVAANPPKY